MDYWIYPLLLSLIGGPANLIFRKWYGKIDEAPNKFKDAGAYVRDDSLYSYDDEKKDYRSIGEIDADAVVVLPKCGRCANPMPEGDDKVQYIISTFNQNPTSLMSVDSTT